jgi:hypothetical protein
VGSDGTYPLIERWNGSSWSVFSSPKPSGGGVLFGVTSISSSDVWAAGEDNVTNIGNQTMDEQFTAN